MTPRRLSSYDVLDPESPSTSALSLFDSGATLDLPPVSAKDLIDTRIVAVDGDDSVESACKVLLDNATSCVVITNSDGGADRRHVGLLDYADVNAFTVLALNSHNLRPYELADTRIAEILVAAKKGHVPVRLVANLSDKNPLVVLPPDADLLALLRIFSRGIHRDGDLVGIVSDMRLIEWFMTHAGEHADLASVLLAPVASLPGISQHAVISCASEDCVIDAMRILSEQGVSSVAVVDPQGMLLSAVSVTDVGRLVVPSQSKRILDMPLSQFVRIIKAPDGAEDGVDRFPSFSVLPSSSLSYTMQKLLATAAHRVFLTDDPAVPPSPPTAMLGLWNLNSSGSGGQLAASPSSDSTSSAPAGPGNLRGVVSVLDVLSIFARLLGLEDVDPRRAQRHRRTSSCSARSARSTHSARSSVSLSASGSEQLARSISSTTSISSLAGRSRSLGQEKPAPGVYIGAGVGFRYTASPTGSPVVKAARPAVDLDPGDY